MRVEIQVHRGAAEDAERIFFYLAASHRQIRKSFLCALRASAVKFLFWTRVKSFRIADPAAPLKGSPYGFVSREKRGLRGRVQKIEILKSHGIITK